MLSRLRVLVPRTADVWARQSSALGAVLFPCAVGPLGALLAPTHWMLTALSSSDSDSQKCTPSSPLPSALWGRIGWDLQPGP